MKDETVEADVKAEETPTPETEVEETQPVTEDVKSEQDYKELYENARAAVREEREKRKRMQETAKAIEPPKELVPQEQDAVFQRFLRTEADAYIAKMVSTDPTFKDRLDMVEDYVKQGHDIKEADMMAKAKLMDEVIKQAKSMPDKPNKPTKTETAATSEEEAPQAVSYEDIKSGKDKSPEAEQMRQAMKTYG